MKTGVLLSGGIDSIALTFWQRPDLALTIDYGQRANLAEIRAARAVCTALAIDHEVLTVDCSALGTGDLSCSPSLAIAPTSEWWPFRNQLLVTIGAIRAVAVGLSSILVGSVKTDSTHTDGSEGFYEMLNRLVSMQEGNVRVSAPAIKLTSVELVQASATPPEILCWAHSCHVGNYACGLCRGCAKHYETMERLGYDPY